MRQYQESWTADFGFVCHKDKAECPLCCENVINRTSSIKHHFETKHKKLFEDDTEKNEPLNKVVSRYEKSTILKKLLAIQIKVRYGKWSQSFRMYRQAQETFYQR